MKKIRHELIEHQKVLTKNFELIEKNIFEISKIIKKTLKKNGIIYMAEMEVAQLTVNILLQNCSVGIKKTENHTVQSHYHQI